MEPYYDDGLRTIYNADCRDVLPSISNVDLVVTDPPYGINFNQGDLCSKRECVFGGRKELEAPNGLAGDGHDEAYELFDYVLAWSKTALKRGAAACICCSGGGSRENVLFADWSLKIAQAMEFKQAVVWDKGYLGVGLHFRRSYEFILIGQNGSPAHRWNGGKDTSNVWRIQKIIPQQGDHPTPKPVSLMAKCMHIFSNEGDLVVDPFMGQGPTLEAANRLGRRAIGIEIDERHCERAALRVLQKQLELG